MPILSMVVLRPVASRNNYKCRWATFGSEILLLLEGISSARCVVLSNQTRASKADAYSRTNHFDSTLTVPNDLDR